MHFGPIQIGHIVNTYNEHPLVGIFWGMWVGVEFIHLKESSLIKKLREVKRNPQ